MMNLLEIMQAAQGGNAYQNLASQFGIRPEQAEEAVKAVLPAVSMGLQQQAETLEGWQNILGSLSQAQQSAAFFDSDGDGIPDHLENEGQNAIGGMFGTPEATEAVAGHAAQFAGLPSGLIQQMLPVIASMIMGGLFKGAANNGLGGLLGQMMQGGGQAGGLPGGLGSILGGMLGQGGLGQAMAPQQPAQQPGLGGLLGGLLGGMMGGGQQAQPQQGGMGGAFGNILGNMMGGQRQAPPQQPADPMMAGLDALKGMFQAGHQVQNTQLDALQQMFQQFNQRR